MQGTVSASVGVGVKIQGGEGEEGEEGGERPCMSATRKDSAPAFEMQAGSLSISMICCLSMIRNGMYFPPDILALLLSCSLALLLSYSLALLLSCSCSCCVDCVVFRFYCADRDVGSREGRGRRKAGCGVIGRAKGRGDERGGTWSGLFAPFAHLAPCLGLSTSLYTAYSSRS